MTEKLKEIDNSPSNKLKKNIKKISAMLLITLSISIATDLSANAEEPYPLVINEKWQLIEWKKIYNNDKTIIPKKVLKIARLISLEKNLKKRQELIKQRNIMYHNLWYFQERKEERKVLYHQFLKISKLIQKEENTEKKKRLLEERNKISQEIKELKKEN